MRKFVFTLTILSFILQTACSAQPQNQVSPSNPQKVEETSAPAAGYPAATEATTISKDGYPVPAEPTNSDQQVLGSEGDHYVLPNDSVALALSVAMVEAKKWRSNPVLMQIPRLRQMERNLNLPKGPSGWFFAFMDTNGSAVELYVEVIGQEVVGKNEVQQLFTGGKPPYKLVPLDPNLKLLTPKDAFNVFLESTGKDYIKGKGRVELDFQLLQLEGVPNPVWSIYNAAELDAAPLASVDAVTGKLVGDPLAAFR